MIRVSVEVALCVRSAATKVTFSQAYLVCHCPQQYREIDKRDGPEELVDFQDSLLTNSRRSIPSCWKARTGGSRPMCMNKDLLIKLRHKKEAHKR